MLTSNQVVVIAAAGDMILEVGADEELKLLASDGVLRSCSFSFKALTGTSFREGQFARSAQSPQIIVLQDDVAQAMEDMCLLLHGQEPSDFRTEMAKEGGEEDTLKIVNSLLLLAVVIDKYACVNRLRRQTSGLIFEFLGAAAKKPDPDEWMSQFVDACYMPDNQRGFRISTERLTKETTGFPKDEDRPQGIMCSMMPDRIKDAITAKRDRAAVIFPTRLCGELFAACASGCDHCQEYISEAFKWELESTNAG